MVYLLEWIGAISIIVIAAFITYFVIFAIKEAIERYIYQYKYKHRFNKPPTAKCYCRDCIRWNSETGECGDHCNSRRMGADWFCCFAEPLSKTQSKEMNNDWRSSND